MEKKKALFSTLQQRSWRRVGRVGWRSYIRGERTAAAPNPSRVRGRPPKPVPSVRAVQ